MTDEARVRARVPARVARITDEIQNTYGAFVGHSVKCEHCKEAGWRCEVAEGLWQEYKAAQRDAEGS